MYLSNQQISSNIHFSGLIKQLVSCLMLKTITND